MKDKKIRKIKISINFYNEKRLKNYLLNLKTKTNF